MTRPNQRKARALVKPMLKVVAISSVLMAMSAQAQNLVVLVDAARAFDANYQSAKLQYQANIARAEQARAGILPTAGLNAGASLTSFDNSNPLVDRNFSTQNATLTASHPLYRPANRATYEQGLKQIELAKAVLEAANQELMVRSSQAYFDVLAAQDTLAFVGAQKTAVAEQLASAKRNFEVGTSTITDTREAQARFDLVTAQEISADNDLRIKRLALDTLVGRTGAQPKGLVVPVGLPPVVPQNVNLWVDQSAVLHPSVRQAQNGLEIAELEVRKAEAGQLPTLDLNASYNMTRSPSGSASSAFSTRNNTAAIGLAFNLPLFTGFASQNRIQEALSLKDKAQSDLEGAKRTVALATRTAYFGVQSGQGQVKALEAAELSSQSALDANKLGYQVGVRINIDVLNAQSQLFQTKRDLAQARYNVLLGGLRLRQANGTLTPEDLLAINSLLAK
jgi:outer membrane protein